MPTVYFCGSASSREARRFLDKESDWVAVTDPNVASHLVATHHPESAAIFLRVVRQHHVTLFFAGEAEFPDFNLFDFAVGFDTLDLPDRYVRLHPLTRFDNWVRAAKSLGTKVSQPGINDREFFCDFIYSNPNGHEMRGKLFQALDSRETVHSWGRLYNNTGVTDSPRSQVGDWREEKLVLQTRHRFSLSVENAFYRGYTSEKILSSFLAGSIPIYWGNPLVADDFNPARFVNVHEHDSVDALVDHVFQVNSDDAVTTYIAAQPIMTPAQEQQVRRAEEQTVDLVRRFLDTPKSHPRMRGRGTHPGLYLRHKRRSSRFWPTLFNRFVERLDAGLDG